MNLSSMQDEDFLDKVVRRDRGPFDAFMFRSNPLVGVYTAVMLRRLQLKAQADGNIGIGFILTETSSITWPVFSKSKNLVNNPCFLGFTGERAERRFCSEFRILNGLACAGDITPDMKADVDIYTDNPPCDSCAQVIKEFLTAFRNVHMKIIYKNMSDAEHYCEWPRQMEAWDSELKKRLQQKRFVIPPSRDLFMKNRRYVFVVGNGENECVKWRYQYMGIDEQSGRSIWKNEEDGTSHLDVEFRADYDEVFRYSRGNLNERLPLDCALKEWIF